MLLSLFFAILFFPFLGNAQSISLESGWHVLDSAPLHTSKVEIQADWIPFQPNLFQPQFRGERWLVRIISKKVIQTDAPAIYLGRIGDADEVFWNYKRIGSTGIEGENTRFLPHIYRLYQIPLYDIQQQNLLAIHVKKVACDICGFGFRDPLDLQIGTYNDLLSTVHIHRFIRTLLPLLLGFMIFAFGLYHLVLFYFLRSRRQYLLFGFNLVAFGVYSITYSFWPYEIWLNRTAIMYIHAISSFLGLHLFCRYLVSDASKLSIWLKRGHLFLTLLYLFKLFLSGTYEGALNTFLSWHPFLVLSLLLFFGILSYRAVRRGKAAWFPILSTAGFFIALIFDVLVTQNIIIADQISVPTFMLILSAGILVLGRDFAHAYLDVEATVANRTSDLRTANERLREMDQMKERFFANISHDFKTPITVASGALDDIKHDISASIAERLTPARRSLTKLLGMIQTLLDTVKAESGTLKMHWENAPVKDIIEEWTESFELLAKREELELQVHTSGYEGLRVPMDVEKVQRVFDNLMSNAIKFTDKGTISVRLRSDRARFYLDVIDSGMGIPEEERTHVFDRFYQTSRTDLTQHGGSGIGLSFSKEMMELHNGDISVKKADHGGSCFTIAFPLSQDVELAGEHEVKDRFQRAEELKGSLDVTYPPERPEKESKGLPKVLCAEDNPDVAQIVVSTLSEDFSVHFASNGERAWERLQKEVFAGLVSDITMPKMSGDELVRKVRKDPKLRDIPIVMLTSHGDEKTMVDLFDAGANDYVTKPFRKEVLLARVRAQLTSHLLTEQQVNLSKLIELGQLAGGMAHQGKNRLARMGNGFSGISKFLKTLEVQLEERNDPEEMKSLEKLKKSEEMLQKGYHQVKNLLTAMNQFSSGFEEKTEISIKECIANALELVSDEVMKHAIKVESEGLEGLAILGYTSFNEVIVNLLHNGVQAIAKEKEDGAGVLTIEGQDLGEEICLRISDNGMGIEPEDLPRIFRIFFTTKDPGEGTGLGLSIVKDFVEVAHGGRIEAASDGKGKGAVFTITVPKEAPERDLGDRVSIHGVDV